MIGPFAKALGFDLHFTEVQHMKWGDGTARVLDDCSDFDIDCDGATPDGELSSIDTRLSRVVRLDGTPIDTTKEFHNDAPRVRGRWGKSVYDSLIVNGGVEMDEPQTEFEWDGTRPVSSDSKLLHILKSTHLVAPLSVRNTLQHIR